jgi:hypothetical protein
MKIVPRLALAGSAVAVVPLIAGACGSQDGFGVANVCFDGSAGCTKPINVGDVAVSCFDSSTSPGCQSPEPFDSGAEAGDAQDDGGDDGDALGVADVGFG